MKVGHSAPQLIAKNRAGEPTSFSPPADGWIMLVPKGDFDGVIVYFHEGARVHEQVTQRFDDVGLQAMESDWKDRASEPNFPGMLVDFDHFSHNTDKPSEAAGWIEDVELREDGLWGRVRWTELGREKVEGGVYRLVSPVLSEIETVDGESDPTKPLVRPRRIDRLALTNDPKLRGMPPVANRCGSDDRKPQQKHRNAMNPRDLLCKILGLSTECTDEELAAAAEKMLTAKPPVADVEAMRNRLRVAESELSTLRNRQKELEAEALESTVRELLPKFRGGEEKLRQLLSVNRVAVRDTILATEAGDDHSQRMGDPGRKPTHSSSNRARPTSADPEGNGGDGSKPAVTDADGASVRLRAEALALANPGWGFNRAFAEAVDEFHRKRRAASQPAG